MKVATHVRPVPRTVIHALEHPMASATLVLRLIIEQPYISGYSAVCLLSVQTKRDLVFRWLKAEYAPLSLREDAGGFIGSVPDYGTDVKLGALK